MTEEKIYNWSVLPKKPSGFWYFVEWTLEKFLMKGENLTINKINCENLKPPYIVIGSHASFADFPIILKAMGEKSTWVVSIEEFVGRNFVMRGIGGIYKHKFTNEISPVKGMIHSIKKLKTCCTFFPEARFSLIGKNEPIDKAIGKLIKKLACPVVTCIMHGNFLRSPQWGKHPYRKLPLVCDFNQIVTKEESELLTADEIQKRVEENFIYDDYKWQLENKISITSDMRAEGIHKVLYQCPVCKKEHVMMSSGTKLWCTNCGKTWEMNEYGELKATDGVDVFTCPSDWYDWEKQNVKDEVLSGKYSFTTDCKVEKLINPNKGFIPLSNNAKFTHTEDGFTIKGEANLKEFLIHRDGNSMSSVHIEYDFRNKGGIFDIYDGKYSYWIYPKDADGYLTKAHFAQIAIYEKLKRKE